MRLLSTREFRLALSVFVVAGVAASLSACKVPLPDPSDAQRTSFSGVYEQRVDWAACTEEDGLTPDAAEQLQQAGHGAAECADIRAPYDWNDPDDPALIALRISRVPATGSDRLGAILMNPGGPGSPGVTLPIGMALSPGIEELSRSYDLIGFDPRGIGQSTPLECVATGSQLEEVELAACIDDNPIAHTMGTSQVARDMELIRNLLGEDRLDFLGYSYGTMLGATYATLFPGSVGRMVLDSAEDAQWASPVHRFRQRVAIANALVELASSCQTDYLADGDVTACPFVSEDSLLNTIANLNAAPLIAADGTALTGDLLVASLTQTLYASHYQRSRVLETISRALQGDPEALDEIVAPFRDDDEDAAVPDPPDLAQQLVTCHSFPDDPDIAGLMTEIDRFGMPRLFGGPEVTDDSLAPLVSLSCYVLPEAGTDITDAFSAAEANPVLVIGIVGDHATPYPYAEVLTEELGNATLLTLEGQGHAASFTGRSRCIDEAVTAYFLDGVIPPTGTTCRDD